MHDDLAKENTPAGSERLPLAAAQLLVESLPSLRRTDDPRALNISITPGRADAEDIGRLLSALSDLQRAHGGHGLRFVPKFDGTHGLVAFSLPPVEPISISLRSDILNQVVELGAYKSAEQFVAHSFAVERILLLGLSNGWKYSFSNGIENEQLDLEEFAREIAAQIREAGESELIDESERVITVDPHAKELISLLGQTHFHFSDLRCAVFAVNLNALIVRKRADGLALVRHTGNGCYDVELPTLASITSD